MFKDGAWSRRSFLKAAAGGLMLPLRRNSAMAAPVSRPVRIGFLTALSGVYSKLGRSQLNGLSLYFDQVGWNGGGRKIELIKEDEEASPDRKSVV